jgi:hypothetical protein
MTIGVPRLPIDCFGSCHVTAMPSGFAVACTDAGGTATGSGTMMARFDGSLRADSPSVTTAYVRRTGRPSCERIGGVSV